MEISRLDAMRLSAESEYTRWRQLAAEAAVPIAKANQAHKSAPEATLTRFADAQARAEVWEKVAVSLGMDQPF